MNSLNDVTAVVEHTFDVLGIDGTSKKLSLIGVKKIRN
jgi:hypothetical protein